MAPKLWSGCKVKAKAKTKKPAPAKESAAIKGLAGFRKGSTIFSGAVDKGVYQQNPALASRATVLAGWDARLIAINPVTKTDRYYILQGLEDPKVPVGKPKRCYAYRRWGQTGTGGVCRLQGPMEQHKVEQQLLKVFQTKTGVPWGEKNFGERAKPDSYWLVAPSEADPYAMWQYLVNDGVDKKSEGWYPYDNDAIEQVEMLYAEHAANRKGKNPTDKRFVKSGSFTYCIDLDAMTQQNTTTMKKRSIRRSTERSMTKLQPKRAPSSIADGLARADTGPAMHRSDTAKTVAPWNDAEWDAHATALSRPIRRSSTSFSEFPGIPRKRPRQSEGTSTSLKDMRQLVASGDVKKLSAPALRTFVRSMGMVASGSKQDLVERARVLVMD